jgi:hypothetical protein
MPSVARDYIRNKGTRVQGALSPGVKRSGREADIQPDLQKDEVVRSMHA